VKDEFTDVFDSILLDVSESGLRDYDEYKDSMEDFTFESVFGK